MNIKQLRKKVLELAFSGELTKSDKNNWEAVAFSDLPVEWKRGNATDYLKKLRKRDEQLGTYIGTNCPQVEMMTENPWKNRPGSLLCQN